MRPRGRAIASGNGLPYKLVGAYKLVGIIGDVPILVQQAKVAREIGFRACLPTARLRSKCACEAARGARIVFGGHAAGGYQVEPASLQRRLRSRAY